MKMFVHPMTLQLVFMLQDIFLKVIVSLYLNFFVESRQTRNCVKV